VSAFPFFPFFEDVLEAILSTYIDCYVSLLPALMIVALLSSPLLFTVPHSTQHSIDLIVQLHTARAHEMAHANQVTSGLAAPVALAQVDACLRILRVYVLYHSPAHFYPYMILIFRESLDYSACELPLPNRGDRMELTLSPELTTPITYTVHFFACRSFMSFATLVIDYISSFYLSSIIIAWEYER
jgi:hypothetical protein